MLDNDQKRLILDYCLGLTTQSQAEEAEKLIESDNEAAKIHETLKSAISPLQAVEEHICPDHLVENTLSKLNNVARSEQLEQLLDAEQAKTIPFKTRTWPKIARIASMAAVIVIAFAIWNVPLGAARQKYFQQRCRMQMSKIFSGFASYASDHNEKMPSIAAPEGSPWWKVGYQGDENHSNTRNLWLLVKGQYVKPEHFICPGQVHNRALQREVHKQRAQLKLNNDFPGRQYVTYSFRIRCSQVPTGQAIRNSVIMADMNPLFEKLPSDYSKSLKLELSRNLMVLNSFNHNYKGRRPGQNVLRSDGSVTFLEKRFADISTDDIYTLQEMSPGSQIHGSEIPSCLTDAFLAP
jgi:hypothetical protein